MLIQIYYLAAMLFTKCTAHYLSVLRINKNEVAVYCAVTGDHTIGFLNGIRMIEFGKSGRYTLPQLHETAGIKNVCNLAEHCSLLVFRFYLHNDLLVSITSQ